MRESRTDKSCQSSRIEVTPWLAELQMYARLTDCSDTLSHFAGSFILIINRQVTKNDSHKSVGVSRVCSAVAEWSTRAHMRLAPSAENVFLFFLLRCDANRSVCMICCVPAVIGQGEEVGVCVCVRANNTR